MYRTTMSVYTDAVLGLQLMLHYVKEVRNEWFMFGIALGVPLTKLREIEALYTKEGLGRCMLEMAQYWLDTDPCTACWEQVARALEQVNQLTLAAHFKQSSCVELYWCNQCIGGAGLMLCLLAKMPQHFSESSVLEHTRAHTWSTSKGLIPTKYNYVSGIDKSKCQSIVHSVAVKIKS